MAEGPTTRTEALKLLGRSVLKLFEGKWYKGTVTRVYPDGKAFDYRVCYEDGDKEDLNFSQLSKVLVKPEMKQEQFENAERASKRSRHTSGVLGEDCVRMAADGGAGGSGTAATHKRRPAGEEQENDPERPAPKRSNKNKGPAQVAVARAFGGELLNNQQTAAGNPGEEPNAQVADDHNGGAGNDTLRVRKKGSAGHIYSIYLENFMCHQRFELILGTHVTLISGTNGSGKSAIMQALQACLGVRARETGRATNLKGFIRTGQPDATIRVTLCNTGTDAYQFERFGSTISIERRLAMSGSSSVKLLNHKEKVVATRKDEVDAVLDYFGINAANPLTVITQDMVRSFLSAASDDKRNKYKMFMEGTLLEEIKGRLNVAGDSLEQAAHSINAAAENIMQLRAELRTYQERLSKLDAVETLCAVRNALEHTCAWANAHEYDGKILGMQERISANSELPGALKTAIAEVEAQMQDLNETEQRKLEAMRAYQEEAGATMLEQNRLQRAVQAASRLRTSIENKIRQTDKELQNLEEEKQTYTKVLEEDTNEKAQERRIALEEFQRQINAKRQVVEDCDQKYGVVRAKLNELREEHQGIKTQESNVVRDLNSEQSQLSRLQQERQTLGMSMNDNVRSFGGAAVATLVNLIRQHAREFHRPPIGPLGIHLGLKDSRWSTAIELALGGYNLESFIVHDNADAGLLRSLAKDAKMTMERFNVIKYNMDTPRYTVLAHKRPPPELTTAMDVLSISGDERQQGNIFNVLVDRAHIECVVLVDTESQGIECRRAANVLVVYDIIGGSYKAAKGSTLNIARPRNARGRLGMDVHQQIKQIDEAIMRHSTQLGAVQEELRRLQGHSQQLDEEIRKLAGQELQLTKAKKMAVHAMRDFEGRAAEAGAADAAAAGGVDDEDAAANLVLTQIQNCEFGINATQVEIGELQAQLADAKRQQQDTSATFNEFKNQAVNRIAAGELFHEEITALGRKRHGYQKKLAEYQRRLSACTQDIEQSKLQVEQWEEERRRRLEIAGEICSEEEAFESEAVVRQHLADRVAAKMDAAQRNGAGGANDAADRQARLDRNVAVLMSLENLDKELTRVNNHIVACEKEVGGNRDELDREVKFLTKKHVIALGRHQRASEDYKVLDKAHLMRVQKFHTLKTNVIKGSCQKFRQYLHRRHHTGRIEVDEDTGEMWLEVKILGATNPKAKAVTDLKQLSGGERSYTTVAFLLAIGQWTESPFRCMDEFDVFMDAINRRVATETLLQFAYENGENQYIFLTPQDIQAVEDAKQELGRKLGVTIPDGFVKTAIMLSANT